MRITAPQGSSLYEEQMEEIERQAAGQPGPMAMANIAAPMPQMQQPAIAPPTQQDPSLGSQAKEMVVDKAIGAGMDKVMDTAAGAALGKMGAAFGPMGMIAGEVAGQFLPQLLKRGLGFNDGGHVGPLGVKYYNTGTPGLFGDAYADPNKAASASTSAAYQGAPMQNAVTELGKIERPTVGPNTGGGGFGGFLSGLFNSPVFAPLSNLVSGVGQWAGEAFPAAESSAAAKAISADANKGKNWLGADEWTWNIGNRNFTTRTPEAAHKLGAQGKPGGISDWQYVETLKNTGGSPYKGFKGALNAALPGAVGATPVYDKKTNKTNWFHKPTPQQLHPHLKEKGHAYSDGGKVGPLGAQYLGKGDLVQGIDWDYDSDGSHIAYTDKAKNYKGPKPRVKTFGEMLQQQLDAKEFDDWVKAGGGQNWATTAEIKANPGKHADYLKSIEPEYAKKTHGITIDRRPFTGLFSKPIDATMAYNPTTSTVHLGPNVGRSIASGALKAMGPLGTLAAVLEPTQAAVATRDPVDAAPMGLEAEMFKRQAALNEAKNRAAQDMIDSNQTSNEIQHDTRIGPLNYDYSYDKNLWDNVVERGKEGVKDVGTWVMPKVIDRVEGLMNLLGPLAPKEKRPVYQVPMVYET